MTLYISVVNHNHDKMICENPTLRELASEHKVILKSNTPSTEELKEYCKKADIILLQGSDKKGFGANNNEVFKYAETTLNMSNNDHFLVLNPDVEVTNENINLLLSQVAKDNTKISTINLFKNKEMTEYDNSIRQFPTLMNPIKTLAGIKRTDHYNKSIIYKPTVIDWAAGSFLLFKFEVYKELSGFDEQYFMYFEDVDICRRSFNKGDFIIYYPHYKAIHTAQMTNRKILSVNFLHYLFSTVKYFIKNNKHNK